MNIIKKIHKDLVSIIIPFYNEKYYFDKCVSSVLKQTYSNIEIIIVNDGSDQIYLNKLKSTEEFKFVSPSNISKTHFIDKIKSDTNVKYK